MPKDRDYDRALDSLTGTAAVDAVDSEVPLLLPAYTADQATVEKTVIQQAESSPHTDSHFVIRSLGDIPESAPVSERTLGSHIHAHDLILVVHHVVDLQGDSLSVLNAALVLVDMLVVR
jgi:hypothetical protein